MMHVYFFVVVKDKDKFLGINCNWKVKCLVLSGDDDGLCWIG